MICSIKRKTGIRRSTKPIQRKARLRRESPRHRAQRTAYNAEVRAFMKRPENQFCPVWASGLLGSVRKARTRDNHHTKGRDRYYRDQSTWLAVSRRGHDFIHDNPAVAFQMGWLKKRGKS